VLTIELASYFRSQQVSLQWMVVLPALALELGDYANPQDLRRLFFNVGQRLAAASANDLEGVDSLDSLDSLELRLNGFWGHLNWGWVDLQETGGFIEIAHHASPLAEAFGNASLEWSVGLLEGFYQSVFRVLGADDKMLVKALPSEANGMTQRLKFGV
jgi:hypothetical protein